MMRLLSFIVFLTLSNAAMAEWVGMHSDDEFDVYVDTTTIRKNGNFAKMWTLNDYKTGRDTGSGIYLSRMVQAEYDCRNETKRLLALNTYSGNMGSGKVISSYRVNEYELPANSVAPRTIDDAELKIACE